MTIRRTEIIDDPDCQHFNTINKPFKRAICKDCGGQATTIWIVEQTVLEKV